jgi:5-methylcytosine-specific restriction protein A
MTERTRGTAAQRGYDRRWQRYAQQWKMRFPLCGDRRHPITGERQPDATDSRCVQRGLISEVYAVDHIVPHRGDPALFWEPQNHQSLCRTCHNAKSQRERRA